MKLSEVYAVLEGVAPKSLSDEYCRKYDGYDNSGILIDCGKEVEKILFSLDLSAAALDAAEAAGANVIVTHHPAIYAKIGNIVCADPQGKNLQRAIARGVSVISMHLNFDCAAGGIDEWLLRALVGNEGKDGNGEGKKAEILEPLASPGCGYGRVCEIAPLSAEELAARTAKVLSARKVWCYGGQKTVRRVASFCGAGGSESGVKQAAAANADCIVSADFKHHVVTMALEYGMSVIQFTHYATENYGFQKIYEQIRQRLGAESCYFSDERLL